MGDRINKISIGKYDQVIALTQQAMNASLQAQYEDAKYAGLIKPQNVISPTGQGFYNAVFDAARIMVDYSPSNLSSCRFRMRILSGELRIFNSLSPGDESIQCWKLENFYLTCSVNIGLVGVAPDSDEYRRIRNLMNKPGDYTLQQLLVDFASANPYSVIDDQNDLGTWTENDWILSSMDVETPPSGSRPGPSNKRPDNWELGGARQVLIPTMDNLKALFGFALSSEMITAYASQLGFIASTTDMNSTEDQATFVPSDVLFQTYPYTDQNGQTVVDMEGNGRANYILYLEMTDNDPLPTGDEQFLDPTNGNWTNGPDSSDAQEDLGTYVLSWQKFLKQYFVPKLNKVNRMMSADYVYPSVEFKADTKKYTVIYGFNVLVGVDCKAYNVVDPDDDVYAMSYYASQPAEVTQMVKDAALNNKVWSTPPSGSMSWYQWQSLTNWAQHDKDSGSNCDSIAQSSTCSRLTITPGQTTMTLEGFTRLNFGYKIDPWLPLKIGNVDATCREVVTWKVEFKMIEVDDGGLSIVVGDPVLNYNWQHTAPDWGDGAKNDINKAFDEAKSNLANLLHDTKNALEGNDKFYFPSRGRFFFKDPLFGHTGDLVVKCGYNGLETGNPNPDSSNARDDRPRPDFFMVPVLDINGNEGG